MKVWYCIPLILLLTIAGSVDGQWSLAPKPKEKPQTEVARIETKASALPKADPIPPDPSPLPPVIQPPYVRLPPTLTVKVGGWLPIEADTNCQQVKFKTPDEDSLNVFPDGQLVDPLRTVVSSMAPGQYRIMAFAAMADVPAVSEWCIITVTGAQPPPAPPQPVPTPPIPVPPVTATNLTVVTIDDVTTRTPAMAAILTDPFWFTLKAPRFKFYKLDVNSAGVKTKYAGPLKMNGGQPVVVIFNADTGAWLNQNPDDLKLPATSAGLQTLIKKYGGQI